MTKYIVVTGGVISGVGKGVATASIGRILKEYGFSVTAVKIDPYINCDAGTMRPTEHGEVWVTEDGGEIDQDLGNYERFLEQIIPKRNNITTGQVYLSVIEKERRGDFLGRQVMFIPHITDEVKNRIIEAGDGFDFCLVEIGGTIGDYENVPFLFAVKNLETELGKENLINIMVSYMPIPSHIQEMKTKPTQLAVKMLRENGIQPDFILCRGERALDEVRKKKIEKYANIPSGHVISMPDVTGLGKPNTLYVIPLDLENEGFGEKILSMMNEKARKEPDWSDWMNRVNAIVKSDKKVRVGIVGKYLDIGDYALEDSYISIKEALKHAGAFNKTRIEIEWIDSKTLEGGDLSILDSVDGVIVPGGFGNSGVEGKIMAVEYCREKDIPFLGLCYGLQLAVVEFARNVCGLDASSAEFAPEKQHLVIDILPEQKEIEDKGGTMRLGAYKAVLKKGSKVSEIYDLKEVYERHRHRYEVNPKYHELLERDGLVLSGKSEDGRLVEFIEIPEKKFFIATQAHPEFKSSLMNPAPLFRDFVKACLG